MRGSAPRLHPARVPPPVCVSPPASLTAELQDLAVQVAVAAVGRLLGLGQGVLGGAGGEADLGPGLQLLQGLQAPVRHQGLRGTRDRRDGGRGWQVPQVAGPTADPGSLTCLSSARRFCSSESLSWPQCTWGGGCGMRTPVSRPCPRPPEPGTCPHTHQDDAHHGPAVLVHQRDDEHCKPERVDPEWAPGKRRAVTLSPWGPCPHHVPMCHPPTHLAIHPSSYP